MKTKRRLAFHERGRRPTRQGAEGLRGGDVRTPLWVRLHQAPQCRPPLPSPTPWKAMGGKQREKARRLLGESRGRVHLGPCLPGSCFKA